MHLLKWLKKNTDNSDCGQEWEATGNPMCCWWVYKMVEPLWKAIRRFLTNLNIHLLCNLAIPLLGINPREMKNLFLHRNLYANVYSSFIDNNQKWKQPTHPSTSEWVSRLWYIHTVERQWATKMNYWLRPQSGSLLNSCNKWKRSDLKEYNSLNMTFWTSKIIGMENISVTVGWKAGQGADYKGEAWWNFEGEESLLYIVAGGRYRTSNL